MRSLDGIEGKILRVFMPLLVYSAILLLTQAGFGIYALWKNFGQIYTQEDGASYRLAWAFATETDRYMKSHSLLVMAVAGVITSLVLIWMWKRDANQRGMLLPLGHLGCKATGCTVGIGIFAAAGLAKAVTLLPLGSLMEEYESVNQGFVSNPMLFQILTLCILSPITEELIFRGLLYGRLKEYLPDRRSAMLLQALIFGIYHGNVVQGIYATLLGVLLVLVYERYASFYAPVLLHMAANTMALCMTYSAWSVTIQSILPAKLAVMLLELAVMAELIRRTGKTKEEVTKDEEI